MSAVKEFLLAQDRMSPEVEKTHFGRANAQKDAEGVYLVINTKLASRRGKHGSVKQDRERLKWGRLRTVRALLRGAKSERLQKSRTTKCMYVPVAFSVEHWKIGTTKAFLKSVVICGIRTICPVCNEKIAARDREELQAGLVAVFQKNWDVCMVTYTIRHNRFMSADESLSKLNTAIRRVKSGRKWQELKTRYGFEGSITALENTYSFESGHHPHKHVLEVLNRQLNDAEIRAMRDDVAMLYLRELGRVGADADFEVAVDIRRGNDYAAGYIAKLGYEPKAKSFGVSYEMVNYSGKKKGAEFGHYSMLQLVDLAEGGNTKAGEAFLEYAEAFRGREMLAWSKGLREKLGLPPKGKTDKEKAQMSDDEKSKCFALYETKTERGWRKARERLSDVIPASLNMDFEAFKEYLKAKEIDVENPVFEIVDNGFGDSNPPRT